MPGGLNLTYGFSASQTILASVLLVTRWRDVPLQLQQEWILSSLRAETPSHSVGVSYTQNNAKSTSIQSSQEAIFS